MNQRLRQNLREMAAEDKETSDRLAKTGELFEGYHPEMEQVHLKNARELERMLDERGWLGKSLVGIDGAENAWLIVQHAISLPNFQRKCLRLIEKAVAEGEAEAWQAAYLEDRIRFFEGKPQRYGTQSDWNERGEMQVYALEDEEKVNDYRAQVGLEPLKSLTWKNEETGESKPENFRQRQIEFEAWARKVGWR